MSNSASETIPSTDRIAALTDGVFAFAMTLLVLNIDVPSQVPRASANQAIADHLMGLWPDFQVYLIAFVSLAAFWSAHQRQFLYIKRIDGRLLWNNIIALMFIALVPFSTRLAGDYGDVQSAVLPMEVNLLVIGLLFYRQWSYATSRPHLLHRPLDPAFVARAKERSLILIAICLVAMGLSFLSPSWSTTVFVLIPFVYLARRD